MRDFPLKPGLYALTVEVFFPCALWARVVAAPETSHPGRVTLALASGRPVGFLCTSGRDLRLA